MTGAALDSLAAQVAPHAQAVGLRPAPPGHPAAELPLAGGRAWVGDYAWLTLWPVAAATPEAVEEQREKAEAWFAEALADDARYNVVIDAYVVLALPDAPGEETLATVRRVELATHVCRKHVVWWSGAAWEQAESITLLGLPAAPGGGERAAFPTLPADQDALIQRLRGGWKAAADEDLRRAGLTPSQGADE